MKEQYVRIRCRQWKIFEILKRRKKHETETKRNVTVFFIICFVFVHRIRGDDIYSVNSWKVRIILFFKLILRSAESNFWDRFSKRSCIALLQAFFLYSIDNVRKAYTYRKQNKRFKLIWVEDIFYSLTRRLMINDIAKLATPSNFLFTLTIGYNFKSDFVSYCNRIYLNNQLSVLIDYITLIKCHHKINRCHISYT